MTTFAAVNSVRRSARSATTPANWVTRTVGAAPASAVTAVAHDEPVELKTATGSATNIARLPVIGQIHLGLASTPARCTESRIRPRLASSAIRSGPVSCTRSWVGSCR